MNPIRSNEVIKIDILFRNLSSPGFYPRRRFTHQCGVDYVSSYQKLFDFSCPGERVLILCTSGNLSITQAITYQLEQEIRSGTPHNLHTIPSLYDAARYIGQKTRQLQQEDRPWLEKDHIDFQCNFLLAGQIAGHRRSFFLFTARGIAFVRPQRRLIYRLAKRSMANRFWIAPSPMSLL